MFVFIHYTLYYVLNLEKGVQPLIPQNPIPSSLHNYLKNYLNNINNKTNLDFNNISVDDINNDFEIDNNNINENLNSNLLSSLRNIKTKDDVVQNIEVCYFILFYLFIYFILL
jgi:hypothetical protein